MSNYERGGWWKWWQIDAMIARAIRQHSMRADLANERAERWKQRHDKVKGQMAAARAKIEAERLLDPHYNPRREALEFALEALDAAE